MRTPTARTPNCPNSQLISLFCSAAGFSPHARFLTVSSVQQPNHRTEDRKEQLDSMITIAWRSTRVLGGQYQYRWTQGASATTLIQSRPFSVKVNPAAATASAPNTTPKIQKGKPKGLILHMVPRGRTLPSPSPYSLKLWTYLNMTGIDYKIDTKKSFGPKGKSPWITTPDGRDIADSQICIETLGKLYGVNLAAKAGYTAEQLGVSTAARIMLEEHFVAGLALWRSGEGFDTARTKVFKLADDWRIQLYYKYVLVRRMRKAVTAQGIGLHSDAEIKEFMYKDLRAVSAILGTKPYILGPAPCEDDCGIFGMLAQVHWGLPDSPYERYMREEVPNLVQYVERVKTDWWPNWDKELARV